MPNRIANVALTVHRDKKRVNVKPGEKFNFTKEEIDDFTKLSPFSLRLPINEGDANEDDNKAPTNPNLTGGGKEGGTHTPGNGGNGGDVDLDSLKVDELRKYAKDNDLDVDTNQNKEPLLAAIKATLAGDL